MAFDAISKRPYGGRSAGDCSEGEKQYPDPHDRRTNVSPSHNALYVADEMKRYI